MKRSLLQPWLLVLLLALAFVARTASVNLARATQLTGFAGGEALVADAASPTGWAGGVRGLVLPELNHAGQQWIVQTQTLLAGGPWRVRRIDADNAPSGRETLAPSPYRGWLALAARLDHALTGRPLGQSAERAAVWSGAALLALLLVTAGPYVARQFGGLSAALVTGALTFVFPFAGNFLSPLPGDRALALALAVWTLLPLAAGLVGRGGPAGRAPFVTAALGGAALLWVDAPLALLLLGGTVLGGTAAAWWSRQRTRPDGSFFPPVPLGPDGGLPPWRLWSWVGAGATLLAWLAEYAPAHLGRFRPDLVHPLHALTWLAAGEWLHAAAKLWLSEEPPRGARAWLPLALAGAGLAALPVVAAARDGFGLLGPTARTARIALLPGTPDAANVFDWVAGAPASAIVTALLPLALLGLATRRIARGHGEPYVRAALALVLGPAGLLLAVAVFRVGHWAAAQAALLVVLAVLAARVPHRGLFGPVPWLLAAFVAFVPALDVLSPKAPAKDVPDISENELEVLLARDLAHWLAARAPEGGAVVLAPPALTGALHFFGGHRGLGTPDPENKDGFGGAVRICGSSSADEAEALLRQRTVTHLVLPTWDPFLDEYARLGNNQPEKALVSLLHRWLPPRWLRPVPYALPPAEGLGDRAVAVFAVTEVQEQDVALARLALHFTAIGQPDAAAQVAQTLAERFPDDPVALVARASVAVARGDAAEFGRAFRPLKPVVERGEDADLPWDLRVALALALAQTKQTELARPRVAACVATADPARVAELSSAALFRLVGLAKASGADFADAETKARVRGLLPAEVRGGP